MNRRAAIWVFVTVALLAGGLWGLRPTVDVAALKPHATGAPATPSAELLARGEYLARLGNCGGCHSVKGGAAFSGGRAIETPFGTIYTSNLTADPETGLGRWSAEDFWRAMHNGQSRSGRLLYPAFPYPSYTHVAREDSDAIFAFLQSLPSVEQQNLPHTLRFPFNTQTALAVWRAVYFRPQEWRAQSDRSSDWNRGAYLVRGLGHCAACHAPRNAWGATVNADGLGGGVIPGQNWYAPSLANREEAGMAEWPVPDVVDLLRNGVTQRASVSGPMAEVVFQSTQYLNDEDARAMAAYLQSLPTQRPGASSPALPIADPAVRGSKLYGAHCAQCHGEAGEGRAGQFPALAGNRAVNLHIATNLVTMVLEGGYAPATAGNPRPYGMPPFRQSLGDEDIAAVLTYIRSAWGNQSSPLTTLDVYRVRERHAP